MKPTTNKMMQHRAEQGAILILSMLVLLVLATVLLQIWFAADVDKQLALYEKAAIPIRQAALGAFLKSCSTLVQDLEGADEMGQDMGAGDETGDEGAAGDLGDPGGGMGGLGDPGAGDGGALGEGGGEQATDSLVDSWARAGDITMAYSSDVEVEVLVRDEDGKFNILALASKDEEFAEKCRDRLARIVDLYREGTKADVSHGTGMEIVSNLEDWLKGERDEEKFPKPITKTGKEDEDPNELEDEPICFPLTLEELVMCEEITTDILYGYMDQGERMPGLLEFITIYSNLALDPVGEDEEEPEEDDPFANDENDNEYDQTPPEQGEPGGDTGEEDEIPTEEVETNNGLININTAPLPVLKALIDNSDLSYGILDQIGEFRNRALKAYEDSLDEYGFGGESSNQSSFGNDDEGEGDDEDTEDDPFGDDEEEEDFIFTDPLSIFDELEEYFDTTYNIEDEAKAEFASLLTVTSNVFTIYITVKSTESQISRNYRAVVWRKKTSQSGSTDGTTGLTDGAIGTGSSAEIITLVPLELFSHPIPYSQRELELMENREYDEYY